MTPDVGTFKCSAVPGDEGAVEICNGVDDNCNGVVDGDAAAERLDPAGPVPADLRCIVALGEPGNEHVSTMTCANAGQPNAACVVVSCEAGYTVVNGACVLSDCAPTYELQDLGNGPECVATACTGDGRIGQACALPIDTAPGDALCQCFGVAICDQNVPGNFRVACAVIDGATSGYVNAISATDCPDAKQSFADLAVDVCNGIDDDCDGQTDEDFVAGDCGTGQPGACALGRSACRAGLVACDANQGPTPETCNGQDDNCNGQTDEGLGLGDACTVGVGACQVSGVRTCAADTTVRCGAIAGTPGVESCNGIDDDCDGQRDEDFVSTACVSGQSGVCSAGHSACSGGQIVCNADRAAGVEACNGLDDDCDGQTDEDFLLQTDAQNCGACGHVCQLASATSTCAAGKCTVQSCTAGHVDLNRVAEDGCEYACTPTNPSTETCDGADNNCDGRTDEGFAVGVACTVGLGACQRQGVYACQGGAAVCNAVAGVPGTEVCGGGDEDCDGQADEECNAGPNAFGTCSGNQCQVAGCRLNFADCDQAAAAAGCESTPASDTRNCGRCGNACAAGAQCLSGVCRACDPANSSGCTESSTTPICDAATYTCRACTANNECATRPGNLNSCIVATGACN